jgi:hypothetical protein
VKLVTVEQQTPSESTLYIRGIQDEDGDFKVEVSKNSDFNEALGLVWFSVDSGKLRGRRFSLNFRDYEHLVDVEDCQISMA